MSRSLKGLDKRTLCWTAGVLAAVAGYYWLAAGPQFNRLGQVAAAIDREHSEIAIGSSSPRSIALLQDEVERLTQRTVGFEEMIPQDAELGDLLQKLAEFTQAHALRPDTIKPGSPMSCAEVAAMPIMLRVHGPFKDIFELIKDIERMPRLTQMQRCKLTADSDNMEQVTAELEFRVFHRST